MTASCSSPTKDSFRMDNPKEPIRSKTINDRLMEAASQRSIKDYLQTYQKDDESRKRRISHIVTEDDPKKSKKLKTINDKLMEERDKAYQRSIEDNDDTSHTVVEPRTYKKEITQIDPINPNLKDKYPLLGHIGEGKHGIIQLSKDEERQDIALKISRCGDNYEYNPEKTKEKRQRIINEARILKELKDSHYFVRYIDDFRCPWDVEPLFEFHRRDEEVTHVIAMERLQDTLKSKYKYFDGTYRTIGILEIDSILYQFLKAMKVLTDKKIIHQDINDANISWNERDLKIFDFSAATIGKDFISYDDDDYYEDISDESTTPPEKLLGLSVDQRGDMWSMACVLYEYYMHEKLFKCSTDSQEFMFELEQKTRQKAPREWLNKGKYSHKYFQRFSDGTFTCKSDITSDELPDLRPIKDRIIVRAKAKDEYKTNKGHVERFAAVLSEILTFNRPTAEQLLSSYYQYSIFKRF